MQDEMIDEIERAHPKFVVLVNTVFSWSPPQTTDRILTWRYRYTRRCYNLVGIVDVRSPGPSVILWNDEVKGYEPRSAEVVFTYERRSIDPCVATG
jgi:hypothetical protein